MVITVADGGWHVSKMMTIKKRLETKSGFLIDLFPDTSYVHRDLKFLNELYENNFFILMTVLVHDMDHTQMAQNSNYYVFCQDKEELNLVKLMYKDQLEGLTIINLHQYPNDDRDESE